MTVTDRIVDKFGGLTALSRALGHKHVSTVQKWKQRGLVPAHWQQPVIDAGRKLDIVVEPEDFFDPVNKE